jgi:hypothetical protein
VSKARVLATCSALVLLAGGAPAAEKLKAEQLVKLHLDEGLGPAEARVRARELRGTAQLASRAVGQGVLGGSFLMSSDALSSRLFIQFGANVYEGETFAFDGRDTSVGFGQRPTGNRSALGGFVNTNSLILREGLLGGVLNAGWPLASLEARQARVTYDGLKKLDGQELHRLSYRAKKGQNELAIQLWFEPETWRHLATTYAASMAQSMGPTPVESSQQSDQYFRLEERFSGFERALGLTLPKVWSLRFEASTRTTIEWKYELKIDSFESR